MDESVLAQIEQLRACTMAALRIKYFEVFGEESRSGNRGFLFRRIAYRLQAKAQGDLSERAKRRAIEIADDSDLRLHVSKVAFGDSRKSKPEPRAGNRPRDPRLPIAGTLLTRQHENRRIVVTVLQDGFEYESKRYRSLSAIAREVTGTRWNGLSFFGLAERRNG